MGRRHAQGARRRPRPSPPRPPSICFTSIDILAVGVEAFEVAAASTREHHCDDDHPSDCGQHPVGSPLAKPAAARWHLHINAGNWPAAGPPSAPGGAPGRGHQAGCPSNRQALRSRWVPKYFFTNARSRRQRTPHRSTRRFPDEEGRGCRLHTELSWAANRGERSTSGAKNARWRKQAAPKYGCDRVRCSPNGCDALQQSSGALHCIVGRRGRDESYGCIPLSRAPGTITSLAPRRLARRPLRRARSTRRTPGCDALQRRAHGH